MTNKNSEITNTWQPDPAWDYYEIWESLHSVKAKIEAGLKFLAKQELASNDTDQELLEILEPASDEFVSLIHNELINYVEPTAFKDIPIDP